MAATCLCLFQEGYDSGSQVENVAGNMGRATESNCSSYGSSSYDHLQYLQVHF